MNIANNTNQIKITDSPAPLQLVQTQNQLLTYISYVVIKLLMVL